MLWRGGRCAHARLSLGAVRSQLLQERGEQDGFELHPGQGPRAVPPSGQCPHPASVRTSIPEKCSRLCCYR